MQSNNAMCMPLRNHGYLLFSGRYARTSPLHRRLTERLATIVKLLSRKDELPKIRYPRTVVESIVVVFNGWFELKNECRTSCLSLRVVLLTIIQVTILLFWVQTNSATSEKHIVLVLLT